MGLAALPDGGFVVAWGQVGGGLFFQRYSANGTAVGPQVQAASFDSGGPVSPAANSSGLVAMAWMTPNPFSQPASALMLSFFNSDGNALAFPLEVTDPATRPFVSGLLFNLQGQLLVTWTSQPLTGANQTFAQLFEPSGAGAPIRLELPPGPLFPQALFAGSDGSWSILGTLSGGDEHLLRYHTSACSPDPASACLDADRFRLDLTFHDPISGGVVAGHPLPLTADTTAFWFFDQSNPELVVKLLDGTALNGHHWVFYASLTDIEFDLTVSDALTASQRHYHNPAGTLASAADIGAFPEISASASLASRSAVAKMANPLAASAGRATTETTAPMATAGTSTAFRATASSAGGFARQTSSAAAGTLLNVCHAEAGSLCVTGSRFSATLAWTDPATGQVHPAQAVQLFPDAGSFWFFSPDAIEVQIKVLDGTALNGHFWVFYASLTDVEFDLTVTDNFASSPTSRTYHHPAHSLASAGAVTAF